MSAKASGANAHAGGDAKSRGHQHHDGSSGRAFTVEQKAAVIRIKRCSPTAFYEILGLEEVKTTCSEGDIKKAYRKLSLLTHPDKNGYEGADEAFKLVARAFQVLSDPDKKAKYDRFGGDPDSRYPGASAGAGGASPFSNFARTGGAQRGGMWEEEISPEDLFRQFFGGGFGGPFGGGMFDAGPGFVFNMGGGPGIRIHQFGGGVPRRRPAAAQQAGAQPTPSLWNSLSSLLPLLFLFVLPLLSSLFSGSSTPTGPSVIFDGPRSPYTYARVSSELKIPYWAKPSDVEGYKGRQWKTLDKTAENKYVNAVYGLCERERAQQQRMVEEATGWFFQDEAKMDAARKFEKRNCERLRQMGYNVPR